VESPLLGERVWVGNTPFDIFSRLGPPFGLLRRFHESNILQCPRSDL
jgi:hypothetical protein